MKSCLLITTQGRTGQLRNSLDRLLTHTLPDEILVIDDGGNDGCSEACREYIGRVPRIRYIYNHSPDVTICSFARNIGIKNTDAEIIITSEPELIFLTDVIGQMLEIHAAQPNDVVSAGTVYHAQREGELTPGNCMKIEGWVAPFTALYRRQWLLDVGGWDESFPSFWGWEDTDLLTRLRCAGHGQVIAREIEVLHQWHASNQTDQAANENHFRAKSFHNDGPLDDVVANRGRSWGTIRST